MKYKFLFISLLFSANIFSQTIIFSSALPDSNRIMDGGIIGKVANNYLICTVENHKVILNTYDDKMILKNRHYLDFIPDTLLTIKFIVYSRFFNVVFQTIENGKYFCKGAQLDEEGNLKEIKEFDSAKFGVARFYSVSVSDNKKHILLSRNLVGLKANAIQRDELILNENMNLEKSDHYFIPYVPMQNFITDDAIDNNGNVLFITWQLLSKEKRSSLTFYKSPANGQDLLIKDFAINRYALQKPVLKINNEKNIYYIISFYKNIKNGYTEGLISMVINNNLTDYTKPQQFVFSDSLKKVADKSLPIKQSFGSFFLDDFLLKKDGGFVLIARTSKQKFNIENSNPSNKNSSSFQNYYSSSTPRYTYYDENGNMRYDPYLPAGYNANLNPNLFITYDYSYSTSLSTTSAPKAFNYAKGNVITFSFAANNTVTNINSLSSFLPNASLSNYNLMIRDNQILFIYNKFDKKNNHVLNDLSLFSDGSTLLNPSLDADKDLTFLPEYGKQVDEESFIIPYTKSNQFAFAKISFQ